MQLLPDCNLRIGLLMPFFILVFCLNTTAQNIFRTACQGNLEKLDSLLQETPIDTIDARGRSLLHWAVACGKDTIFDNLVKQGLDINAVDNEKKTPLYMAVRFKDELFFDKLVALQTDNKWVQDYGASLMEKAVMDKNQKFIKKLLDNGVSIDITNERGNTALEIAKRIGANEIYEFLIDSGADKNKIRKIEKFGNYMGESPPDLKGKVFANNFISTEESEFGSIFSKDGTELFYAVDNNGKNDIRYSKLTDGKWSTPQIILSHEKYGYNDPFLSPDENRLYFISQRPLDGVGELKDFDIWYVEKDGDNWSEPINAGPNINSEENEYYISFTNDGSMYFSSNANASEERKSWDYDIYCSKFIDGKFQKAISLKGAVNTSEYEADVFVDPNESYLIFCGIEEKGYGRGDLYISFKKTDGTWTKARNMGANINTKHHELCPFVTHDGKYLFYTSNQDIYWVSTKVIEDMKSKMK